MAITISPAKITTDGGTEITVTSTTDVFPDTATLYAVLVVDGVSYDCWHHDAGKGQYFAAESARLVHVVCPPLPRRTPDLGALAFTLNVIDSTTTLTVATAPGTLHITPWQTQTFELKQALQHFEVGAHDVDVKDYPSPTPTQPAPTEELLDAVTSAVGEMLNEAAGLQFTRLTAPAAAGADAIVVESTFGFTGGLIAVGTDLHACFSITDNSMDVVHFYGDDYYGDDINGTARAYPVGTRVFNLSGSESSIAAARANIFVDFAQGTYLDVLGANLGVPRPLLLEGEDNDYRRLIKAVAYAPRGTMSSIDAACAALLGNGAYELYELLPAFPCTVFLKLADSIRLSSDPAGRAFMGASARGPATGTTVALAGSELTSAMHVSSVKLAPERSSLSFSVPNTAKASTFTEVAYPGAAPLPVWTFAGVGTTEAVHVGVIDGLVLQDTATSAQTTFYERTARLRSESVGRFTAVVGRVTNLTSLTNPKNICMVVDDGTRRIAAGIRYNGSAYDIRFFNFTTDALVGTVITAALFPSVGVTATREVEIRKNGTEDVELWVDGVLCMTAAYTLFPTTTANRLAWGMMSTGAPASISQSRWKRVAFDFETPVDFANVTITGVDVFTSNELTMPFAASTILDTFVFVRGTPGVHNDFESGLCQVVAASGTTATLRGPPRGGGKARAGSVLFEVPDQFSFAFPKDVGKNILILTGPNAGTWNLEEVISNADTSESYGQWGVDESRFGHFSGVGQVADSLVANENDIVWYLTPQFFSDDLEVDLLGYNVLPSSFETVNLRSVFPATWLTTVPGGYVVVAEVKWSPTPSAMFTNFPDKNTPPGSYFPVYMPSDLVGAYRALLEDDLTAAGVILEPVL